MVGKLSWPTEVLDYMRGTGRDPVVSCPLIEERAKQQADHLVATLEGFQPRAVLDIGSGLAAIDVFLARTWRRIVDIHLLDGDGRGEQRSRYHVDTKPWADVHAGAQLVRRNLEAEVDVGTHHTLDRIGAADLVLSSRSWGHHYPVAVYVHQVKRILNPGGRLVLDIRNGTDGVETLERAGFKMIDRVPDPSHKCRRLVFTHA